MVGNFHGELPTIGCQRSCEGARYETTIENVVRRAFRKKKTVLLPRTGNFYRMSRMLIQSCYRTGTKMQIMLLAQGVQ